MQYKHSRHSTQGDSLVVALAVLGLQLDSMTFSSLTGSMVKSLSANQSWKVNSINEIWIT